MSNYVEYYNTRKAMYKSLAERWAKWLTTSNISVDQVKEISSFFKPIAIRFGLVKEFREIGVI